MENTIRKCSGCDLLESKPNMAAIGKMSNTGSKGARRVFLTSTSLMWNTRCLLTSNRQVTEIPGHAAG